jgi:hypothetical protein
MIGTAMRFTLRDASAPLFVTGLSTMRAWLDKPLGDRTEAEIVDARLAPDMRPFAAQYQIASDTAKNAIARLCAIEAPAMPDTETTFAELRDRCTRTIAFIDGVAADAFAGAEERSVMLRFPNGTGYRFTGAAYLTRFALPNFYFHVTTAYAILRNQGVAIGKPDFLQHLGAPEQLADI